MDMSMRELSERMERASRARDELIARRSRLAEAFKNLEEFARAIETLQQDFDQREHTLKTEESKIADAHARLEVEITDLMHGIESVRRTMTSGLDAIEKAGQQLLDANKDV